MTFPRQNAGVLLSQDEKTIYAYGGDQNSIEKLNLGIEGHQWQKVSDLRMHESNGFKFYRTPNGSSDFSKMSTFGGGSNSVLILTDQENQKYGFEKQDFAY